MSLFCLLCSFVQWSQTLLIRGKFLNVPKRDGIPWVLVSSQLWGWGVRHPPPLCVRTYIHVHLWVCPHIHTHNTHECVHRHVHLGVSVYMYVCVCMCVSWIKVQKPNKKGRAFRHRGTNTLSTVNFWNYGDQSVSKFKIVLDFRKIIITNTICKLTPPAGSWATA